MFYLKGGTHWRLDLNNGQIHVAKMIQKCSFYKFHNHVRIKELTYTIMLWDNFNSMTGIIYISTYN